VGRLFRRDTGGAIAGKRANIVTATGWWLLLRLARGKLLELFTEASELATLVVLRLLIPHHGLELF
jgi:hypothetical protein